MVYRSPSLPVISPLPSPEGTRGRARATSFTKWIPSAPLGAQTPRQAASERILRTYEGRERLFRAAQYSVRLLAWLQHRSGVPKVLVRRLLGIVTFISALRKVLRILSGSSLSGIRHVTFKTQEGADVALVEQIASLVDDIFDDVYLLSAALPRLNVTKSLRGRLANISDIALLVASLCRIITARQTRSLLWQRGRIAYSAYRQDWEQPGEEASLRRKQRRSEMRSIRSRLSWLNVESMQAVLDANFAAYDVFSIRYYDESVRAVSGFLSACLGLYQFAKEPEDPLLE